MKKNLLILILFIIFQKSNAQYVTIPDVSLRAVLKLKYPACFNGSDMMDTSCSTIINASNLNISGMDIETTNGLQYFKKLKILTCSDNLITSLTGVSDSVHTLNCSYNLLTSLPRLPKNISNLACSNNLLNSLPSLIQSDRLVNLNCSYNNLTTLPALPNMLQYIYCSHNQLTSLPPLPTRLIVDFDCSYNKLTALPEIPFYIYHLICSNNQITSLPPLGNFSLFSTLDCSNNLLSSLPALPTSLNNLYCRNNPIACLPLLPSSLADITIKNTNVFCLPNATSAAIDTTLLICGAPNGICELNPFVKGRIYNDINNNNVFDSLSEQLLSQQLVRVTPNNWLSVSDVNGNYIVKLDTVIINSWNALNNYRYATVTPTSYTLGNIHNLRLQNGNYDFGIHLIPNVKDLETTIAATPTRPGFATNVAFSVDNVGTVNQSNITIKLKKPTGYSIVSTSVAPTSTINDTLIWKNISLNYLQHTIIFVQLQVPASAVMGTPVNYEAWANGTQGDSTPLDNYTKWIDTVRSSFDPNDKLVNKATLPPTYNAEKDRLVYTIRFQNTGTDTAFTVIVRDEIPNNLDVSSLRVVNASHTYQLIVREKNIVEVAFPNIQLPDSNINEAKSHGFVQLEFKPKAGLPINAEINNNASIFFDYNSPVITNTATTRVQITTGIADNKKLAFKLFPNPSSEKITVELPYAGNGKWLLIDITGKIIKQSNIENNTISFDINVNDIESGTYLLSIESNDNLSSSKIVIFR